LRLLLDEHFCPEIARRLKEDSGHDVVSVCGTPGLEGKGDGFLLEYAAGDRRAIVTQNIIHFAPLHAEYLRTDTGHYGIVFAPSRRFSRSKKRTGELVHALDAFLVSRPSEGSLKNSVHWL